MKILAVAGDAGGARALQTVIHRLQKDGITVECYAYAAAIQIWEAEGFTPRTNFPQEIKQFDKILLGTTVSTEQNELVIIRQAQIADIPTVSVLDFWTNYRARFTTADGDFILPKAIAVMDEPARHEMIGLDFPKEILHVTGQPAFDELADYLIKNETNFLIDSGQKIKILYVSQPLSQLYHRDKLGFDEYEAIQDVVNELAAILEKNKRHGILTLKLHPREADRTYNFQVSDLPFLEIVTAEAFDNPRRVVQNSDFVIGMNSILLMEACIMEKPVISYQPNLRIPDPLPSNKYRWSKAIYQRQHLAAALENELFDVKTREMRKDILDNIPKEFNAAEKVAELILTI